MAIPCIAPKSTPIAKSALDQQIRKRAAALLESLVKDDQALETRGHAPRTGSWGLELMENAGAMVELRDILRQAGKIAMAERLDSLAFELVAAGGRAQGQRDVFDLVLTSVPHGGVMFPDAGKLLDEAIESLKAIIS